MSATAYWLARLKHDLVKQVVWRARDLRDLGQHATPADMAALGRALLELRDGEGRAVDAVGLWDAFMGDPDAPPRQASIDDFGRAVRSAQDAVVAQAPEAPEVVMSKVLDLETAFDAMNRALAPK